MKRKRDSTEAGFVPACPAEIRLVRIIGLFLGAAAWAFAALRVGDLPYFGLAAGGLLILTLTAGHVPADGTSRAMRGWWARDLFFWSGLSFLLYLGLQCWNAGRGSYYDVAFNRWTYAPPRRPGWPWAFTRPEAVEMLYWFFPAWALGLALRAPCLTRQGAERIAHGLAYGGGVLAAFGIIQFLSGTRAIFWTIPLTCEFFASFPYANHAAAYLVMVGALAAGLLFREVFRPAGTFNRGRAWALGSALALCLTGANLSLSRAGMILSWVLAAFIAGYGITRGWRALRPANRLYLAAATVAAGVVLYFAVAGLGREAIRGEFAVKRLFRAQMIPAVEQVNLDLSVRPILWKAGWEVFRAHPIYGTGGWGFRYLAAFYLSPEHNKERAYSPGWASVHNDPLQFLVEFGLAGCGLMTLALGVLVAACLRRDVRRGAVYTLACAGLLLVVAFSLIDLPFRCPAILWTWVAVLSVLPKCAGRARPTGKDRAHAVFS